MVFCTFAYLYNMVDSSHTDRYALFLLDHVISRRRWDVSHVATPTHYGRVRMNNHAEYYINRGVGPRLSENSIDLTFSNNFRQSGFLLLHRKSYDEEKERNIHHCAFSSKSNQGPTSPRKQNAYFVFLKCMWEPEPSITNKR